jgi:prepilin-type N-terminal cleavage/methylation domain-containing protein
MQKKHGFTLLELLVVIAIIGILAGIVAPKLFRAMDTAKEQQCRNNLRQLQTAVIHYAADQPDGKIPFAQTFEKHGLNSYSPNLAWVVWVPKSGTADATSMHFDNSVSQTSLYGDDLGIGDSALWAIRNGELYDYVGDPKSYACPVTVRNTDKFMKTNANVKVWRTYAMNHFFGAPSYPIEWGTDWRYVTQIGVSQYSDQPKFAEKGTDTFYHIPQADRLLLFADVLPTPDPSHPIQARSARDDKAHSPFNCSIAPQKFNDLSFEKKGVNWPGLGPITLGIPKSDMLYGLHDPLITYRPLSTDEDPCYLPAALAVFFDGHIEKVFPAVETSDGVATVNANTAWFLNRGLRPSETKPTAN